jgi:HK97 family phage prohead protease
VIRNIELPAPHAEIRPAPAPELRELAAEDGTPAGRELFGLAAVFGALSEPIRMPDGKGYFREKVAPGAFLASIEEADVRGLINHDKNRILGRNKAGTLILAETAEGLSYRVTLPDTTDGRDIAVSVGRGDVTGASFSFVAIEDSWEEGDDLPIRTLLKVHLFDVGPVTFPAYPDATAAVRSYDLYRAEATAPAPSPEPSPEPEPEAARRAVELHRLWLEFAD